MRTVASLILLVFLHAPLLQAQFEGLINLQVRSYSEAETTLVAYTMSVKNDMLSIVTAGGKEAQKGNLIIRGDKHLMWIIDDDGKQYIEFPLVEDSAASKPKKEHTPPASKLTRTGKSKKVLGYPCEEYVGTMNGETSSIWASPKLGKVYDGLYKSLNQMSRMDEAGNSGNSSDWQSELVKMKLFPLSITTKRGDDIAETQDVVSIATKSMPQSAFEPPAGYLKQSMQNQFQDMIQQMKEKMKEEGGEKSDTSGG